MDLEKLIFCLPQIGLNPSEKAVKEEFLRTDPKSNRSVPLRTYDPAGIWAQNPPDLK